jgi:hypothetical protein
MQSEKKPLAQAKMVRLPQMYDYQVAAVPSACEPLAPACVCPWARRQTAASGLRGSSPGRAVSVSLAVVLLCMAAWPVLIWFLARPLLCVPGCPGCVLYVCVGPSVF